MLATLRAAHAGRYWTQMMLIASLCNVAAGDWSLPFFLFFLMPICQVPLPPTDITLTDYNMGIAQRRLWL